MKPGPDLDHPKSPLIKSSKFVGAFKVPYSLPVEDTFVKPWPQESEMTKFYDESGDPARRLIKKMGLR